MSTYGPPSIAQQLGLRPGEVIVYPAPDLVRRLLEFIKPEVDRIAREAANSADIVARATVYRARVGT